jgi:CO dehydrogenase nickel-insertion accessory protein CooC1
MTQHEGRNLSRCRLGVFGKGGSGKSTAVVLLARALVRRGYDVSILDADSTNVGLHRAMGAPRAPTSLLDFYGGMVFSGGSVTCPVDDPSFLQGGEVLLADLPREYYVETPDGIRLLVGGKIGDMGPGAGCDGPISKIARDFVLKTGSPNEIMLVDFKAGFEDSARGALTNLDWVIQILDPNAASLSMTIDMAQLVVRTMAGSQPATEHLEDPGLIDLANDIFEHARVKGLFVLINRVGNSGAQQVLQASLEKAGIEPVGVISDNPSIPIAWLLGERLTAVSAMREAAAALDEIEARAAECLGKSLPNPVA